MSTLHERICNDLIDVIPDNYRAVKVTNWEEEFEKAYYEGATREVG